MKFGKKTAFAALVASAALVMAGCAGDTGGGDAGSGDGGSGDKMYIALVSKGFQHQFWQAVKKGAEERAAELGVDITFEGPAAETEIDAQLQMLQTAIDKGPDAIAYAALDPEACVTPLQQAKDKDIPVVYFDAPCDGDVGLSLSATDSKVAGALAAEHMADLIGGKGEVGIVGHSQINSTGVERRDGFVEKIEADYPDIKIVDIQYGDGDHLKSADIAKAMIAAHPDLKGIYGTNEGSAIGVVNAVNELGLEKGKLTIVGFDSGAAQINAIKDGTMAGAITQDPIGIGAQVVQAAYDAANGKDVEEFYDTGSYWYDKTNIEDPKIAAVLYE
ncbi:ABC transporter substrate-binding protein [Microbacterium saperdae]|uniref:Monosaccharide ABC transporter substrate-binding protein (CUT2 family) n=1 Tax=Microbacterium saperdae TaxID=69368 RepID=A0A543BI47_9MICO|nr:ABC transporter substrate-binding protein [Microbacterium saperdae]TQL84520.1 monosaccharide ABC transporter substrate-binding protein (CUT2 family) [Microbacterium saperdae]GGM61023.1 LacI family transcriptional regulator [Microbacterium saperdae]